MVKIVPLSNRKRYNKKESLKPLSNSEIFKESLKVIAKEYCEDSPICALKNLVDDRLHYVERVIWVVALVGALIFSICLVLLTFHKFYTSPLVTTQVPEGIVPNKITFPAVSVCTTNRISKKKVTELARELVKMPRNKDYNEEKMLVLLRYLGQFYNYKPQALNVTENLTALHKALGTYDVNELLKNLTPSCEEILVKCSWGGYGTSCSNLFEFRLTMNGYCCAFNYLRDRSDTFDYIGLDPNNYKSGNRTGYGDELGLKLLIKFVDNDNFYFNIPIKGVQLQITGVYDFPDAPSGSYSTQFLRPGVNMQVYVESRYTQASRDIQLIPVKVRKCLFRDESPYLEFYTHSECMLKCRMMYLKDMCDCVPFHMPKMDNVKTCDLIDLDCLKKHYVNSITTHTNIDSFEELQSAKPDDDDDDGIDCPMCYPGCFKNAYSIKFSNIKIYPDAMNKVPATVRPQWLVGADYNSTGMVHVRHAATFGNLYTQNIIMQWFDLFSNIGSTCGFVTGLSFVSVLEFLYFFTIKLARKVKARKALSPTRIDELNYPVPLGLPKVKDTSPNSGAKYRNLYWGEMTGSIRPNIPID